MEMIAMLGGLGTHASGTLGRLGDAASDIAAAATDAQVTALQAIITQLTAADIMGLVAAAQANSGYTLTTDISKVTFPPGVSVLNPVFNPIDIAAAAAVINAEASNRGLLSASATSWWPLLIVAGVGGYLYYKSKSGTTQLATAINGLGAQDYQGKINRMVDNIDRHRQRMKDRAPRGKHAERDTYEILYGGQPSSRPQVKLTARAAEARGSGGSWRHKQRQHDIGRKIASRKHRASLR